MLSIDELNYRDANIPLSSSFTPLGSICFLLLQVLCLFPLLRYNSRHNQLKVSNSSWPAAFSLEVPAHGPLSLGLRQIRTSTAEGSVGRKKGRSQCWSGVRKRLLTNLSSNDHPRGTSFFALGLFLTFAPTPQNPTKLQIRAETT